METRNLALDVLFRERQEEISTRNQDREMSEATTATIAPDFVDPSETDTIREMSVVTQSFMESSLNQDMDINDDNTSDDNPTFIIATDFGTTFSSVAFTKVQRGRQGRNEIIVNYPEDPMTNGKRSLEVPTESWYLEATEQGGFGEDTAMDIDGEPFEDIFDDGEPNQRDYDSQSNWGAVESTKSMTIDSVQSTCWGYEIQTKLLSPDADKSQFKRLSRFKLLLDESEHTQVIRDTLRHPLKELKQRGMIKKDHDVIADYLTLLFQHTKEQLTTHHGFSDSCSVEHVLCVPNIWTSKACRTMQTALETAVHKSQLGSLQNLFIISEPEAAATYVLDNSDEINPGETFIILDAGGGTVDVTTYTVHKHYPLRLRNEAVTPGGGLHGSSYLNGAFKEHLLDRLKTEDYLEVGGYTIKGIVDAATVEFENRIKRTLNVTRVVPPTLIRVQGLRENPQKRFSEHGVQINHNDWVKIFKPVISGVSSKLIEQINLATDAGLRVQKIVLTGGFSESPSLRGYLDAKIRKISAELHYPIRLIHSESQETAVALGAVMRALDKEDGPSRIPLCSYGFLRTEPHEPAVWEAHKGVRPTMDKLDGNMYVQNTIDWLVKIGHELPPRKEYSIPVEHTFSTTIKRFMCEEVLYVSDTSTKSHYRASHIMNKGAEVAGRIVADMTFLKSEGLIDEIQPKKGERGRPHYRVNFELVMIIDGRNLRYEARYPPGSGTVRECKQISIAAAFVPGTN